MFKLYLNVVDLIRKFVVIIMDIWMKIIENNWYYFGKELFVNMGNDNVYVIIFNF